MPAHKQLLFLVLNKTHVLDRLLDRLNEAGIKGATVINSCGMAHALASREDSHIISSIRMLFSAEREENKTIFMIVNEKELEAARRVVHEVVGDLSKPNTAIMFSVPIGFTEGLTHIDERN